MSSLEVKVKKLREDAIIPKYQTEGAAGFDFHAAIDHDILLRPGDWREIPFGIAMEIPPGYELRIRSRSGLAFEHQIIAYHGLIDSDYRGPLSVLLHNASVDDYVIKPGARVAQGVLSRYERATFVEALDLSETVRGENGFGSTGL
ncbi:dUTP diphosphatase [Candidatus Saccharibacteria bacterium]|nr:dUTP diphosphatase [Candidatus Saccharibacteria bacterium]MBR3377974.1 dUTP diphosphatase [Candidatus Saccharibacteria bacterium]